LELNKNKFFKKWIKNAWPYITGAVLLSLFQIVMLASTGNPWGITATLANWGAWIFQKIGGSPEQWYYFNRPEIQSSFEAGFFNDPGSFLNLGIILGALLATLLASQFKIRKIKSKKQVVTAILGGLLMGYGARIAFGCNIGALFSGISSLSVSGWVFALFLFWGAIAGGRLLKRFFL